MDNTLKIRQLNDDMRRDRSGRWIMTSGIQALGPVFMALATQAVQGFTEFTADNDPHGEHDFGAGTLYGQRIFWKIDYYDKSLSYGSDDPADPAKTERVLTIMLAEEY